MDLSGADRRRRGPGAAAGRAATWRAAPGLSAGLEDDRLVAYALAADPVFAGMRALIGQLSGILILAQARLRRDVADLPDTTIARERWAEVVEHLARVEAPEARLADLRRLQAAITHVGEAIAVVAQMRPKQTDESVDSATAHLKAAYRLMQNACDHRLGLTLVDTSAACCSCGSRLA